MINTLKKFDLNESDARVYLSLYQNGPSTGYEASKLSGVARSKVYNVLEKLLNKGFVVSGSDEKNTIYKAEDIEVISSLLEAEVENNIEDLKEAMKNMKSLDEDTSIWKLRGYENILNKAIEAINGARDEVLIQVWSDELTSRLEEAILLKEEELEKVLVILYDQSSKYETRISRVLNHGIEEEKLKDVGGRWITITIDSKEMIHASVNDKYSAEGIYTKNSGMVFFAREYIKHDAYTLKVIDGLNDQVKDLFGQRQEGIRGIFNESK